MEKTNNQINFIGLPGVGKSTSINIFLNKKRLIKNYLVIKDSEITLKPRLQFTFLNKNFIKSFFFKKSKIKNLFYQQCNNKRFIYYSVQNNENDFKLIINLMSELNKFGKLNLSNINLIHQLIYCLYYSRNFKDENRILLSEKNLLSLYLSLIFHLPNFEVFLKDISFIKKKNNVFVYLTQDFNEILARYLKRNVKILKWYNKTEEEVKYEMKLKNSFYQNSFNILKNEIDIHILKSDDHMLSNLDSLISDKIIS